jgi:DNA ligase (NAD+)
LQNEKELRALVDTLNRYAYEYYVLDAPTVSDGEYDRLFDRLSALEAETGEVLFDSPTRKVGGAPISAFSAHIHTTRLYSLDKCQSEAELRGWHTKLCAAVGDAPGLTVEYKLDGLTLTLTYQNGRFVSAATRGDGEVGEDVTAQVLTIRSFPLSIPYQGRVVVQGEGIMKLSALAAYNATAAEPLKNARNGVAGAIRNLDPKVTAARKLDIVFYAVVEIEGTDLAGQRDMLRFLQENKFLTFPYLYTADIDEAVAYIDRVDRRALDFLIDGMVVKVDDANLRERLGFTDRFPRWAVAFKYPPEECTTLLRAVVWQVGRTGKLTPLAVVDPVELSGATVSRATLNNAGDIARKGVAVGARVWIRRSNEVIPEITGVSERHADDRGIAVPARCPACGAALVTVGAHIFCPNADGCTPQIVARLAHYAAKDCMDIEGLSEKTIEILVADAHVRTAADLYRLTAEDVKNLRGFAAKSAKNLISAINASKTCTLAQFLHAIGIPNIGKKTAKDLAVSCGSLAAVRAATKERLLGIEDFGEIVADAVLGYFEANGALVDDLLAAGVNPTHKTVQGVLTGKRFVLTGTLPTLKRSEAEKLIAAAGGVVGAAVTKDTDYLLCGEDAGSKLEKAKKLKVRVIDEAAFRALVNAPA